jgi:hypothetical protein
MKIAPAFEQYSRQAARVHVFIQPGPTFLNLC